MDNIDYFLPLLTRSTTWKSALVFGLIIGALIGAFVGWSAHNEIFEINWNDYVPIADYQKLTDREASLQAAYNKLKQEQARPFWVMRLSLSCTHIHDGALMI